MPNVNTDILSWARDTAGLSVDEAARKLQMRSTQASTREEKLLAYENGTKEPSRALLKKMAKAYRRPLLTFYLSERPAIGDRGEDFRTLPDNLPPEDNVLVDALIRDIKARQSTVRETMILEDEAGPLEFIGAKATSDNPEELVDYLQEIIGMPLEEFRRQPSVEAAFKVLRKKIEACGVFVIMQGNLGSNHTNMDVDVFRGFALADDIAPFIVINDRDARSAWSFTLMHEMAHLLLGQTGVSGAIAEQAIERFCNEVASEFLLPEEDFARFQPHQVDLDAVAEQISRFAFSAKISSTHASYRLFKRGDITRAQWEALRERFRQQWLDQREATRQRNQEQDGGPSYYVVQRYKLGKLADVVKRFTHSGALSTTKAGMLLKMRPLKVHRLFSQERAA